MERKANLIVELLNRALKIFSTESFTNVITKFILRNYEKGSTTIKSPVPLKPIIPDPQKVKLMAQSMQTDIQGVTEDLNRQVQQTVRDGVLNNESPTEIKKRIKLLLNPTDKLKSELPSGRKLNWSDRLENIFRTESIRAQNLGKFDSFKQTGLIGKKYVSVHKDDRLCPICSAAGEKYTKETGIDPNEPFEFSAEGNSYSILVPPFHPQCRCRLMFKID